MTNGTSQGLFIVVAIVIFGIFVLLSQTLFGDQLSNGIVGIFEDSIEMSEDRLFKTNLIPTSQDYFTYTLAEGSKTATITKYIGTDVDVVIPRYIVDNGKQYTVTKIGDVAFYGKSGVFAVRGPIEVDLESVHIPNTVLVIGDYAFDYNNLSSLVIPNSVEKIGVAAFRHNQIATVHMGSNVRTIGRSAFNENELTTFHAPNSLESIGERAFRNNNLTSVSLPSKTTYTYEGSDIVFDSGVTVNIR